jgi:hypothetical protein
MPARRGWIRAALTASYFVVSVAILSWFTSGDTFCSSASGQSRLIVVARLAIACTLWDLGSGLLASMISKMTGLQIFAPLLRAAAAGIGIASVPLWIYRGYGVFWFQGTWADVHCVFSEGFGIGFLFAVAPLFGLASVLHGWVAMRLTAPRAEFRGN